MIWLVMELVACQEPVGAPTETGTVSTVPTSEAVDTVETGMASPLDGFNVLVVMLDDVGPESIGAYGMVAPPPLTPTLDRLANGGVRFDRAYSYPVCSASRAALLTGRYSRRNGFGNNVSWLSDDILPETEPTFARIAQQAGYATALFGKWHLVGQRAAKVATHPLRMGFEHFDGMMHNVSAYFGLPQTEDYDHYRWERVIDGKVVLTEAYATSVLVDGLIDWVAAQDGPWLALLPLPIAHGPMHVPPAELYTGQVFPFSDRRDLFRAMVEAGDTELGRLIDGLAEETLENTVIVVTSDNGTGEARFPEGYEPLGGKGTLYEGGVRVPLIVWGPVVRAPGVHDGLVHLVDVLPTVVDLVNGRLPPAIDGQSLVPLLTEVGAKNEREALYLEYFGPVGPGPYDIDWRAAVTGDRKLLDATHRGEVELLEVPRRTADERPIDEPKVVDALQQFIAEAMEAI